MDKPFIKLFRTPNSGYFYDANKSKLISISSESYSYLSDIMDEKLKSNTTPPNELIELKKQGFLATESVVKKIQHPSSKHLKTFLERKVHSLTLQLTQNCNFRCRYCIYSEESSVGQRSHSQKTMSWETAKKAVDFLLERSVDSPKIFIGFYGGEPLLEFSMIKRIIEYASIRFFGKELKFSITTNGTLINEEMIDYFQEHEVGVMISLDGPKEINDINRVFKDGSGTFDAVIDNIKLINEIAPDYAKTLMINMVIDPENDFDCINSIHFNCPEINNIGLMAQVVDHGYDHEDTMFSDEYVWRSEYHSFLSILSFFRRYPEEEISPLIKEYILTEFNDYSKIENTAGLLSTDVPSGPCIPGVQRLFVNVDEKLFPCERVSETSSAMCIGTLDEGYDVENCNNILNIGALTEAECAKCWCLRHCTTCIKRADDEGSDISAKIKLSNCSKAKASAIVKLNTHLLIKEVPIYYSNQLCALEVKEGGGF